MVESVLNTLSKNIKALSVIVIAIIGCLTYFASSSDLNAFRQEVYQRQDRQDLLFIEKWINQRELAYSCFTKQECIIVMPSNIFNDYVDKITEKNIMKNFLKEKYKRR